METRIIRMLLILNFVLVSFLFLDGCKKDIDPLENSYDKDLSEKSFKVPIAFPDQGEIVSFNLAGDTVFFRKIDTLYVFQGDIIFTESQIKEAFDSKGAGIGILNRYWPNGIIPYKISPYLSQRAQKLINGAINIFNEMTNVKFIKRTNESVYCEFVKSLPLIGGTSALMVGRIGLFGGQTISIKDNADLKLWEIEHEMCHALGLLHEQCRSDRDKYIIVNTTNIKPVYRDEFRLVKNSINPTEFDFGSVMMYPPSDERMERNHSEYLITDLNGDANWCITGMGISQKDIATINYLYPKNGICSPNLISPESDEILDNGCANGSNGISWLFNWSRCAGASSYNLYVMGPHSTIPLVNVIITEPEYLFSGSGYIIDANRLGWTCQVRAMVKGKWGEWSEVRKFDVEPLNTDCAIQGTFGEISDIIGDSNGPDLTYANISVSGTNIALRVEFEQSTFNSLTTCAQFSLDTDCNPATGHPGMNANGVDDAGIIGVEYLVRIVHTAGSLHASVWQYAGSVNNFTFIGDVTSTYLSNGIEVTVPLSLMTINNGILNFKVITSTQLSENGFTSVQDYMTNLGQPVGRVR